MKKLLSTVLAISLFVPQVSHAAGKPHVFSQKLKDAVKNCTPYSEDVCKKNSDLCSMTKSVTIDIKGRKDSKCSIFFFAPPWSNLECAMPQNAQEKLLRALNNSTTEKKKKTIVSNNGSVTMTATEFELVQTELANNYCHPVSLSVHQQKQTKKCSSSKPLMDVDGTCYSCNTTESIRVKKGKCTSVCPDRTEGGMWDYGDISGVFCYP